MAAAPASTPAPFPISTVARYAGANPFAVSTRITGRPRRHPKTRQTFVPPMLPLPCRRMSVRLTAATSQYPVGIEPAT
jgi:hypothetical protein